MKGRRTGGAADDEDRAGHAHRLGRAPGFGRAGGNGRLGVNVTAFPETAALLEELMLERTAWMAA